MTVNIERAFGEKKSKELVESLNNIVNNIVLVLYDSLPNHSSCAQQWSLFFDNGNTLSIEVGYHKGEYYKTTDFFDPAGISKQDVSLQEALNINKYSKALEKMVDEYYKSEDFNAPTNKLGRFTYQPLDKDLAIFNENNISERNKSNDFVRSHEIHSINVNRDER